MGKWNLKNPELSMGPNSSSSINLAYLKLPTWWRSRCRFSTPFSFDWRICHGKSSTEQVGISASTAFVPASSQNELGETPGTTLWNSSFGWGLRTCSWHEQSIAILLRACSFVNVSLCFISQYVQKHYLMIFNLILCSIFRQQNLH